MSDSMADKIGKLLAKAERTDNPHEAEAYTAKAERLMIRWGIEEATARAANGGQRREEIVEHCFIYGERYGKALMQAFSGVAMALGLKTFRRGWTYFYIVGHESDVQRATELLTSLQLQATSAMWHWWKSEGKRGFHYTETDKANARRAFYVSFGIAVAERLEATRKEEVDAAPGAALVLVSRASELDDHMTQKNLSAGRRSRGYGANSAGAAAGRRADLGGTRIGGRSALS